MEPQRAWSTHAACRGDGPATFYPQSEEVAEFARAKAVCRDCHVRADCLGHALAFGERHGVWGGFTPTERRRILMSLSAVAPDAREHGLARILGRGLPASPGRLSGADVIPWVQTLLA
jgi:WhiB family redox-sensing transcriptional regulator